MLKWTEKVSDWKKEHTIKHAGIKKKVSMLAEIFILRILNGKYLL